MKNLAWVLIALPLTGCGLFQQTAKPSEITLVEAMRNVGAGLKEMQDAQGGLRTGLVASSVDVTFNVAASDKKTGNLTIDLSKAVTGDVSREKSVGGGVTSEVSSSKGNTITVHFINLLTIPKDTVAYTRSPDDIKKLFESLPEGGIFLHTPQQ